MHEMLAGSFQSLGLVYFWDQQVPHPVLHEYVVAILVFAEFDAFVENLYLIV